MKQQTAVEWLAQFISKKEQETLRDIIQQAKVMERKQITAAFDLGILEGVSVTGEDYYMEVFTDEYKPLK